MALESSIVHSSDLKMPPGFPYFPLTAATPRIIRDNAVDGTEWNMLDGMPIDKRMGSDGNWKRLMCSCVQLSMLSS